MRRLSVFALLVPLAGCSNANLKVPCNSTVRVEIDYDEVTSNADLVRIGLEDGVTIATIIRPARARKDTVDIHVNPSYWGISFDMFVTVFLGVQNLGWGDNLIVPDSTCKGPAVSVKSSLPVDMAMPCDGCSGQASLEFDSPVHSE
jgi:hypothetical protein